MNPDTPLPTAPTAPAPLQADPAEVSDLGEFRVASSAEIADILRRLQESQTLITLRSDQEPPLVSRLCSLELATGTLGLEQPVGGVPQGYFGAEVTCEAYLDHIRVQFELATPVSRGRGADAMLVSAIPALVYRFQRRKAFRVKPHSRAPHAEVKPAGGHGAAVKLRILDVSMGGLALLLPPETESWPAGEMLSALVDLDRHTHFRTGLRVQHVHGSDPALGTQIGCAFTRLDRDAERALQLFIDQTQKLDRLMRK
jgi:c-di-GMP-binding flagellar brake protein YcgR